MLVERHCQQLQSLEGSYVRLNSRLENSKEEEEPSAPVPRNNVLKQLVTMCACARIPLKIRTDIIQTCTDPSNLIHQVDKKRVLVQRHRQQLQPLHRNTVLIQTALGRKGINLQGLRCFNLTPGPYSGLDCLICAIFYQRRGVKRAKNNMWAPRV